MSPIIGSFSSGNAFGRKGISGGGPGGEGPVSGTGGTVSDVYVSGNLYRVHTFTSNGNFTLTAGGDLIEVFLVGGGGGGGVLGGGGGGGGVMLASTAANNLVQQSYSVVVGNGGTRESGWQSQNTEGGESSVFDISARGGGAGQSYSTGNHNSQNVANTGGDKYNGNQASYLANLGASPSQPAAGGFWSSSQWGGFSGGPGDTGCCSCNGGGGAGANGNGYNYSTRTGGDGISVNFAGTSYYWAGGGGSDGYCSITGGSGGLGGGGAAAGQGGRGTPGTGGINTGTYPPVASGDGSGGDGGANTGGGGGSGCNGSGVTSIYGGNGGTGIVMIRYRI